MKLRSIGCLLAAALAALSATTWIEGSANAKSNLRSRDSSTIRAAAQKSDSANVVTPEKAGPYFALLIGINDYRNLPKLKTAVHDAESMAALLHEQYGFDTKILKNPSRDEIKRALNVYRRELERN